MHEYLLLRMYTYGLKQKKNIENICTKNNKITYLNWQIKK